jgi:hypothetical protein
MKRSGIADLPLHGGHVPEYGGMSVHGPAKKPPEVQQLSLFDPQSQGTSGKASN